ncbi:MAG: Nramp family divalent metal transporter [Bacteroidota bacterium]
MAKSISWKQGLRSLLFWSIISAAFIGPGTVTTASKAGASFQLSLLWALVASIGATILLQEAAARLTIASGKSLGEIIALKYQRSGGKSIQWMVFFAVAFGCMAYQAGNMLGALSGLALIVDWNIRWMTIPLALLCAALLWIGNFRIIANLLGLVVALMGLAFVYAAFQSDLGMGHLLVAVLVPSFPEGASLLIVGLVGTTIVPYNLFLASGISQGQSVSEMRIGIVLAVIIGGMISIAILLVGTQVLGEFSFVALSNILMERSGNWVAALFGFGLFAAGLSSSITSPLAAAVTAQSLFGANDPSWSAQSARFRMVWGIILAIGLLFGWLKVKPIPAIILAQAINGALLPIIASFLLLAVNDRTLIPEAYRNSSGLNLLMLLIVALAGFLGLNNVLKAMAKVLPAGVLTDTYFLWGASTGAGILCIILGYKIFATRSN